MVLVPILTLVANMFDRRGSFRVVITQEYAPLAATIFYVTHGCQHLRDTHRDAFSLFGNPGQLRGLHDPACGRKSRMRSGSPPGSGIR